MVEQFAGWFLFLLPPTWEAIETPQGLKVLKTEWRTDVDIKLHTKGRRCYIHLVSKERVLWFDSFNGNLIPLIRSVQATITAVSHNS